MKFRENEKIFLGVPILLLSFFGLANNVFGLYQYNFSNSLFLYAAPNKVLIINVIISILGIVLAIETMKGKFKVRVSLLLFIVILLIYILFNTLILNYF